MRSDQQQNNRRLIEAAARLFERSDGLIKLADVAEEAGVSVATAYRHFASVDEILSAYRRDIGLRFAEFSLQQDSDGTALLEAVCAFWVDLVLDEGAALVHRRSHEGFLARFVKRQEYMAGQIDALERPLRELTRLLGIEDVPGIQDEAAFLWNVLFDPREIFDLQTTLGLDRRRINARLVGAFRGALGGWAMARGFEQ
ncbi:TetR/AcrR family transcriptional regulator [Kineococcus sp. SYSU DK003]|uniref:TetR/AcrR family transcriptional regulator n=1 Tax=Kineococcus sp. SYSU DK003 TaxID=3383124 RepID=UPI003D7E3D61